MGGLAADPQLAADVGHRQLLDPRQQENLAGTRRKRSDDGIQVPQLFVQQQTLFRWRRGVRQRVCGLLVERGFRTPALQPVMVDDQVVGDPIHIGAAVDEHPGGGDLDHPQPGLLDNVVGITALAEFTQDMRVQRSIMDRAQTGDIR